jgi:adenylate cyclase
LLKRRRPLLLAAAAAAAAAAGLALHASDGLETAEQRAYDARAAIGGPEADSGDVVFVARDPAANDELRSRFRSATGRRVHAQVINHLTRAGAKVIAYDFQFTEPGPSPAADSALFDAVERARDVVLVTAETDEKGNHEVLGGPQAVESLSAAVGDSGIPLDSDNTMRRLLRAPKTLESFAVVVSEHFTGEEIGREAFGDDGALIAFQGPGGTFSRVSFADVAVGDFDAAAVRGRIAVVGTDDPAFGDQHETPVDDRMSGAEVHANAIATILGGFPLERASGLLDRLLIVLLALAGPLAAARLSPWRSLAASALVLLGFLVAAQLLFRSGTAVDVAHPVAALFLGSAGAFAVGYLLEVRERRRTRDLFSRFVPDDVVERALSRPASDFQGDAARVEATVLFADLRGFTRFAESRTPDAVSRALNRYLAGMSAAILDHGGTVVSYMGDGIMAVFGAPVERDDHAAAAVAAARRMLGQELPAFNRWLEAEGLGEGFRMGIGLSTGEVMSGNVGSKDRLEYAALGDTTNVGARLEAMTKTTGHAVLITDTTFDALPDADRAGFESVGEISIPGRGEARAVWGLGGESADRGARIGLDS